ncbi:MAG TPA: sugar phosphate isomerase/epimerase family protein [Bacillota bacterium]|nr:sugar phosphate isomerase/epimerase family protein [Bacillota bacterium]
MKNVFFQGSLKKGTSLSTFGKLDGQVLAMLSSHGFECVELSFTFDYYMNVLDLPKTASMYGEMARANGIEIASVHLPFSGILDISSENRDYRSITLYTNRVLIDAAANAGCRAVVLHPSSEPISDDRRPERMKLSREAICALASQCSALGLLLGVENLPRTCLCRTSDETVELLSGTGAGVTFDTNHALTEDNIDFIDSLTAAGIPIHSMHASDYFYDEKGELDERHCLPGEGINRWNELFKALERANYSGPLMYEISRKPKGWRENISIEALEANISALSSGMIK